MTRLILSTHIPKTGGNSFLTVLQNVFRGSVLTDHLNHPIYHPEEHIDKIHKRGIKAIHGHGARIDKWKDYLSLFDAVAWVRDPYTRVMSHWEYACFRYTINKHGAGLTDILKANDFEAYCEALSNHQTGFLPLYQFKNYAFIGIVEEYQRCLDEFGKRFVGVDHLTMPSENVNHRRGPKAQYELTQDQKAIIEKYNKQDFELYRRATELWK